MYHSMRLNLTVVSLGALFLAACGGGEKPPAGQANQSEATPAAQPAAAAQPPAATPSTAAPTAADITPAMVALGDSIFHGQAAGGICYTCHGPDAKGTQTCPDLTDSQWLHGDGSYPFIVKTVHDGVASPIKYPAPMPPMGGASLSDAQVNAVAAYVYSLSHKTG